METLVSSSEKKDVTAEEETQEQTGVSDGEEDTDEVQENSGEPVEEEEEEEGGNNNDCDEKANIGDESEGMAQATDKTEKIPLPAQAKDKKQADVLNLNNEVVKMRKEVKRVRALIIRKLTRQMGALKKRKGKDAEIEKNQRRAARLLEEIHAMKVLSPDLVTKTALQKNVKFEEVCKNPKSSMCDRAVARIATNPQFSKKIANIKAAVKAFKEERMKGGKQEGKEKVQKKPGKTVEGIDENKEKVVAVELKEKPDSNKTVGIVKDVTEVKSVKDVGIAVKSTDFDVQHKQIQESNSVKQTSTESSNVKDPVQNQSKSKDEGTKQSPVVVKKLADEEESEIESSDEEEEREYFDDSTEERFRKQSSQSEESEDDFFVGKVSKFKKKKHKGVDVEKGGREVKGESADEVKTSDKFQSELDELESRLKSRATSLKSVFCSSLSGSKQSAGGGADRGRFGDKSRAQRKPNSGSGVNRDLSKQSTFQKQLSGGEKHSGSKFSKPYPEGRQQGSDERSFASPGRGRGQGRGEVTRQNIHRGRGGAFSHQAPKQTLHPSWEASKKRKEQQGQILAFQGKKIKFDDDDDAIRRLELDVCEPQNGSKTAKIQTPKASPSYPKYRKDRAVRREGSRDETSLSRLTKRFQGILRQSADGILDLNLIAQELKTAKRRIYDVTNVLEGIQLLEKKSKNTIKWLGGPLIEQPDQELSRLHEEEKKLDEQIQSCKQHISQMCTDHYLLRFAYVSQKDVEKIAGMKEQTVVVIKAPAETTLEVPHPEEGYQVHFKSTQGPIEVFVCTNEDLSVEGVHSPVAKDPKSPNFPVDDQSSQDIACKTSGINSDCSPLTPHSSPVTVPISSPVPASLTSLQLPSGDPPSTDALISPMTVSFDGQQYVLSLAKNEGITDLFSVELKPQSVEKPNI